jgi:murein DD-endopeptidase MepM/ murein hydrolase activator NlpD
MMAFLTFRDSERRKLASQPHGRAWHMAPLRSGVAAAAWAVVLGFATLAVAQPFQLPTANRALFEKGGGERFFVGTTGRPWQSGTFGCVRSEGWQFHEGLDIRAVQRDKRREPADPVMASANGSVAYINQRVSTSNYGRYVVLRHTIDGMEVYTLYAHLSSVAEGLEQGRAVKAGEVIATMGRTSNTRERISLERAHVHFEVNLFVSDRFPTWFKKQHPREKDDHGIWNGMNMLGIDPQLVLLQQQAQGNRFSLLNLIRSQPELCRVLIRDTDFSFPRRYPMFVNKNPVAEKEGAAGYEITFTFSGLPISLTPRAASEIKSKTRYQLLSVNAAEQQKNPCRRLVTRRGARWELTSQGVTFLNLFTQ